MLIKDYLDNSVFLQESFKGFISFVDSGRLITLVEKKIYLSLRRSMRYSLHANLFSEDFAQKALSLIRSLFRDKCPVAVTAKSLFFYRDFSAEKRFFVKKYIKDFKGLVRNKRFILYTKEAQNFFFDRGLLIRQYNFFFF